MLPQLRGYPCSCLMMILTVINTYTFPFLADDQLQVAIIHEWQEQMGLLSQIQQLCCICAHCYHKNELLTIHLSDLDMTLFMEHTLTSSLIAENAQYRGIQQCYFVF